jgi:Tfp pilus assembly protein PilF
LNPGLQATSHLKRALELDPNFALAYALLSNVYAATGQTAQAPQYAKRAYELRDRVSERERFFITFFYHRDATQAWDQAFEVAKAWTLTYPRDAFAFNHLAMGFQRFGQYEQAIATYRRGLELDPKLALLYANLASALLAVDRYDEVDRVFKQAATGGAESQGLRRVVYSLAFIRGDTATMTRALESSVGLGQTNSAYEWQAHAAAFFGHVTTAHEQFQHGTTLATHAGFKDVAGQLAAQDAVAHSIVGQCDLTRQEASTALESSRDNVTMELLARALALCGAEMEASRLVKELESQYPEAMLTLRVAVPIAAAATAVKNGQPERAIALLDPVKPYDHSPKAAFWPAYLRGLAYLQLKSAPQADLEFRSILEHRGEYPLSGIYPLAHLGAARAAVMSGDTELARKSYETFMTLWSEADDDLQPMKKAREEFALLKPAADR